MTVELPASSLCRLTSPIAPDTARRRLVDAIIPFHSFAQFLKYNLGELGVSIQNDAVVILDFDQGPESTFIPGVDNTRSDSDPGPPER